jgi:hypothetical protein
MRSGRGSPTISKHRRGSARSAIHALENLAHSDTGIVMLRQLLGEQLKRVERGLDPINTIRDPSANNRLPTGAWNVSSSYRRLGSRTPFVDQVLDRETAEARPCAGQ